MGRRIRRRSAEDDSEVNVTPMLDVVFIMLIFFIVTASFVKESGLDINRPDGQTQNDEDDKDKKSILVQINGQDQIRVGPRVVDLRAVRPNIENLLAEDPNKSVIVRVDENASNGVFVTVWDQAKQAGAANPVLVQPAK